MCKVVIVTLTNTAQHCHTSCTETARNTAGSSDTPSGVPNLF